jgi:hypothetical protein
MDQSHQILTVYFDLLEEAKFQKKKAFFRWRFVCVLLLSFVIPRNEASCSYFLNILIFSILGVFHKNPKLNPSYFYETALSVAIFFCQSFFLAKKGFPLQSLTRNLFSN